MARRLFSLDGETHLIPDRCENAACGADLAEHKGIVTLTGSWAFRYCNSECSAQGYSIHQWLTGLQGRIAAASNAVRLEIAKELDSRADVTAEVRWGALYQAGVPVVIVRPREVAS
jgi:hypothetical protein